jgi:hypothetical protein
MGHGRRTSHLSSARLHFRRSLSPAPDSRQNNATLDVHDVEGPFVYHLASTFSSCSRKDCWRDRRRGRGIHDRERSFALQTVLDIQAQFPLAGPKPPWWAEECVTDNVRCRCPKAWDTVNIFTIAIPGRRPCRVAIQVPDQECGIHNRCIKRKRIRDGTELIIHIARPKLKWAETCIFVGWHSRGNWCQ